MDGRGHPKAGYQLGAPAATRLENCAAMGVGKAPIYVHAVRVLWEDGGTWMAPQLGIKTLYPRPKVKEGGMSLSTTVLGWCWLVRSVCFWRLCEAIGVQLSASQWTSRRSSQVLKMDRTASLTQETRGAPYPRRLFVVPGTRQGRKGPAD